MTTLAQGWRVLVAGVGPLNADFVARVLNSYGFIAESTDELKIPNPRLIRKFDIVYGIYLQGCDRLVLVSKLLCRKAIIHVVGSDAYKLAQEPSILRRYYWRQVLHLSDLVLYVSPHLEQLTRHRGHTLALPVCTDQYRRPELTLVLPDRDVLYYCPSGPTNEKIYRLEWIVDYARTHPDEKISILGTSSHPANYAINLENVEVIPYVEQTRMPLLYRRHKKLIRMTTEDGMPRMIAEALLSGIKVIHNGREISESPEEIEPHIFAARFRALVQTL